MGIEESCWTGQGLAAPSSLPVMPDLWLRPEELSGIADGAVVPSWPTAFKRGEAPESAPAVFQPHKLLGGLDGLASVRFDSFQALRWSSVISLGGAYSLYVVAVLGRSTGAAGIFGPYLADPVTARGIIQGRTDRFDWQDNLSAVVDLVTLAPGSAHCWSVRRSPPEVLLALDGAAPTVNAVDPLGVSGLDGIAAALVNPGFPNQRRVWVSEVIGFYRTLVESEHTQTIAYLRARYPSLPA